jgi:cytochrome o ubiquinol oxidase operon protein cyoD
MTTASAEAARERGTNLIGYGLSVLLTVAAFAGVAFHLLSREGLLWLIASLAALQIIVQLRCFLHLTLRGSRREDLQMVLFATLLIFLMVGGSMLIMSSLMRRMIMGH